MRKIGLCSLASTDGSDNTIYDGATFGQASVAERPVVLPPVWEGSAPMDHPAVLICVANTLEAARKLSEIDNRFATTYHNDMELLAGSRAAVERSRHLLSELKARATDR